MRIRIRDFDSWNRRHFGHHFSCKPFLGDPKRKSPIPGLEIKIPELNLLATHQPQRSERLSAFVRIKINLPKEISGRWSIAQPFLVLHHATYSFHKWFTFIKKNTLSRTLCTLVKMTSTMDDPLLVRLFFSNGWMTWWTESSHEWSQQLPPWCD